MNPMPLRHLSLAVDGGAKGGEDHGDQRDHEEREGHGEEGHGAEPRDERHRENQRALKTATVAPPSVRPIMIARRGTGATKVSFRNPNWRSHSIAIPENMAVNSTVMPITPGAMNWM